MSAKIPKVEAPNETTSLTSRRVEGAMAATEATEAEETTQIPPEIDAELLFDLQMVLDGFSQCKREDGQLYLDGYLRAYSEINKFFQILGNVFNFVAQDVQKKITILQCYRKGGAGDYYYSIQSMIEYERENNLLTSKDQQSGARTLLRLHRALEFITGFLSELHKAPDESGLGSVTSEVYSRTLAKFHGWVVAKTVGAVLLMMPTKNTIIERVSLASKQVTGGIEAVRAHNEALMPKVIEVMTSVYNLTQKLYEDYEILDLP
ncbi:ceramide-1-phosphate transfer protein-like [Penaeus japonicus]|uniref:ceramide-1-phosphate transfer protein-like n=1 Tax=Penaeus japonicus TaxID=27405 RepID=UPI001C712949|nr:ceramide-1-phosphate transfer protein-like [Penaeus japonicus]